MVISGLGFLTMPLISNTVLCVVLHQSQDLKERKSILRQKSPQKIHIKKQQYNVTVKSDKFDPEKSHGQYNQVMAWEIWTGMSGLARPYTAALSHPAIHTVYSRA